MKAMQKVHFIALICVEIQRSLYIIAHQMMHDSHHSDSNMILRPDDRPLKVLKYCHQIDNMLAEPFQLPTIPAY